MCFAFRKDDLDRKDFTLHAICSLKLNLEFFLKSTESRVHSPQGRAEIQGEVVRAVSVPGYKLG